MSDILFSGWTPTQERLCIRCRKTFKSCLYQLCDECRGEDEKTHTNKDTGHDPDAAVPATYGDFHRICILDGYLERDRQDEIHNARYGY
jgi:hypothetical protein